MSRMFFITETDIQLFHELSRAQEDPALGHIIQGIIVQQVLSCHVIPYQIISKQVLSMLFKVRKG